METEFSFETLCILHYFCILKMNTARYLEMLVPIYQISRRHIPEDDNIDSCRSENLKPHKCPFSYSNCRREKQIKNIPDEQQTQTYMNRKCEYTRTSYFQSIVLVHKNSNCLLNPFQGNYSNLNLNKIICIISLKS